MEVKKGVLGRIKQMFELFIANVIPLTILYLIAMLLFEVVFTGIFKFSIFENINLGSEDMLSQMYSAQTLMIIIGWIIVFLLYLIALIPINIATIKGVKQAYLGEAITVKENFRYAVSHFIDIFRTYWYIFAYVALLPLVFLIVGLVFILLGMLTGIELLSQVGMGITGVVSLLLCLSLLYRGLKSTFAIYNAVDKEEYTKMNFDESIAYTNEKWWRIAGNIILFSIVMMLIGGVIGFIVGITGLGGPQVDMSQFSDPENLSADDLKVVSETLSQVSIGGIIAGIINTILSALTTVLGTIFIFLFYKTLQIESGEGVEIKNISAMKKEARNNDPERGVIEEL